MRACLSTIQQTLTPEAASVLNHSIAEAGRRNHGHTTPLHVASVLLSSSSGLLRQACIRSHPNSSHPLQCRALELCFSVALDRLPTTTTTTTSVDPDSSPASDEPPISNALMAALKRAQAHQRRGCPEQQQQPLLAVKVELEQFIVSILDDPSVSRVMREASFSSPAVKSIIEHSLMTSSSHNPNSIPSPVVPKIGLGFGAMSRNLYLNPRLQSQPGLIPNPGDDVRKVIEILSRTRKKNPVLVGESEPEIVMKEVLRRIENKELGEIGPLRNVEVISVEKEPNRLRELGVLIQRRRMTMNSSVGLILDLGDLKWLVDQQPPSLGLGHQGVSEAAKEAVSEIGKIIGRYRGDDGNGASLWVIGTATCETYLRCQVYHPSMEIEWDLQAVSIAAKAPLHAKFPRLAMNGILGGSVEPYSSFKSLPIIMHPMPRSETSFSQNIDPSRRLSCCPSCLENYEHEVSKLSAGQSDKPAFEVQLETTRNQLPQWLQNARAHNKDENTDQDSILKQKSQELMKKWRERCMLLHPSFHQNGSLDRIYPKPHSLTSLYANPNLLRHQPFQPTSLGDDLRLNTSSVSIQPVDNFRTPPGSPVRTDLVLCHTKTTPESTTKKTNVDPPSKVGELQNDTPLDADSFKKLLKGLIEKVWWQRDAVSSVTTTITRCKLGNGRGRANGAKGDIWMLFSGPDRTGKKKMVFALSELVCGVDPVIICLGSRRESEDSDSNFRGKTVLDRIAEAVKRNPFSVIMLQDIDEADMFVRGSIKRALEKGRFTDSHGREISLGSIIFVLTTNNGHDLDEMKLALGVTGGWQLKLSVGNQRGRKRNLELENEDEERASKQRKEMGLSLSFDLNETADVEEDIIDGSHNSSDVTVEYEEEKTEFRVLVDEVIIFKPVDFGLLKKNVEDTIKSRFRAILGEKMSISIGNEALDKILGGAWLGKIGLESWVEQVLTPTIHQIKTSLTILPPDEHAVARLELDDKSETRDDGDWLPNSVGLSVSAGGG